MSRATIRELAKSLALAVDPQLEFDKVWLGSTRDWVLGELQKDTHAGHQREWSDVKKSLHGLVGTARVRVQDDLADGISQLVRQLEVHQQRGQGDWNDDLPLKTRNLAQHVQLLLNLSTPATSETHAAAYELLHRQAPTGPTPDELLYREIMRERFTGEHWGKGFNEEVKHGWTDSEGEDEATSSDEEIITPHSKKGPISLSAVELEKLREREEAEGRLHDARSLLRTLEKGAYWKRPEIMVESMPDGLNGWRSVSTEISALALAEINRTTRNRDVISSVQLQREMLFALSGRPGVFFDIHQTNETPDIRMRDNHPCVRHLSAESLDAILERVESRGRQLQRLRSFSSSKHDSKTAQAFAESCRKIAADIGEWLGEIEQSLVIGAPSTSAKTTSTPLQILRDFDAAHGDLLDHLETFLELADRSTLLLNAIAQSLDTAPSATALALRSVWLQSAEPTWAMLRDWLVKGMPLPAFLLDNESNSEAERSLPVEFCIQRDGDVEWGDEDFWESAFMESEDGWPIWLDDGDLKDSIMEAGKARGLLMALGEKPSLPVAWMSLESLIRRSSPSDPLGSLGLLEEITQAVAAHLSPICALATFQLRRVLDDECGLLSHLDAIEGVLYMRHFAAIADWSQWLFKQVKEGNRWSDFHLLTGNLRDCIEQNEAPWLNAPAIRITTARARGRTPDLSAIRASYQVPFPLSQIFSPTSMELRSEVFTFLLRVLQARASFKDDFKALSSELACDATAAERAARALRHRLSWILEWAPKCVADDRTLWSWINTVIDIETARFRDRLVATTSVKAMITLELQHTRRIRDFGFLHDHASNAREAIYAILQMARAMPDSHEATLAELRSRNANLSTSVHSLRDEVEELAGTGEPGVDGAQVRQGWSMLAVSLQDWR